MIQSQNTVPVSQSVLLRMEHEPGVAPTLPTVKRQQRELMQM